MKELTIKIAMAEKPNAGCTKSVEEQVREWIEEVESGRESRVQWKSLRLVFNRLASKKKLNDRQYALLKLIEPVVKKWGEFDSDGVDVAATYPCEQTGGNREK